jgi:hypothetical protein
MSSYSLKISYSWGLGNYNVSIKHYFDNFSKVKRSTRILLLPGEKNIIYKAKGPESWKMGVSGSWDVLSKSSLTSPIRTKILIFLTADLIF